MGKHRDKWSRELIANLVWLGCELSHFFPMRAEVEHKIHRGFVDLAWYITVPSTQEKLYIAVFEIETSKSDWPRIRNNAAKLLSLKPLVVFHIFKPGIRLKKTEREELIKIHHGRKAHVINTKKGIENIQTDLAEALGGDPGLALRKKITLYLPKPYIDALNRLVEEGAYLTRAEAIRITVRTLAIEKITGKSLEGYIPCPKCGSFRIHFGFKDRISVCMKCGSIRRIKE